MSNRKITEVGLYISIIILTLVATLAIAFGMLRPRNVINIPGNVSKEQLELIKMATNNSASDSVSNIIATAAIFFTVLVVVISIFEFIKSREVDRMLDEFNKKITAYDNRIGQIDDKIIEAKELESKLRKAVDAQNVYIHLSRAEFEYNLHKNNNEFFIEMYKKCIDILNNYDEFLIEEYEISRLYNKLGVAYFNMGEFILSEENMIKSLEYKDGTSDEVSKRIQLASLYDNTKEYDKCLEYIKDARRVDISIDKKIFIEQIKEYTLNNFFVELFKSDKYKNTFKEITGIYLDDEKIYNR